MKKEALIIILIIIAIFLISCTSIDDAKNETITEEGKEIIEGECQDQWVCLDSKDIIHRLENCSLMERKTCPLGCKNDSCKVGKMCEAGFKCFNEEMRSYQDSACQWSKNKLCDWGCLDGECLPEPKNATNITEVVEEEEEIVIPEALPTIGLGEVKTVVVQGGEHNLSLHVLEPEQVQVILDNKRSDWLMEGDNHTFPSGIKINVVEILFQTFEGGTREISYRLE